MFAFRVHEKEAVILERNRKFHSVVAEPGLHSKLPGKLLKIAARISLGIEPQADNLQTKTKDNVFVTIPTTVHMQVVNPQQFHYAPNGGQSSYDQSMSLILQSVKQEVSNMQFEDLYEATDKLGASVSDQIGKTLEERYGIKIIDVIVDQPQVSADVEAAFDSARSSVSTAQKRVTEAKANSDATVLEAQAHKQEMQLDGEGLAAQRTAIMSNATEQAKELSSNSSGSISFKEAMDYNLRLMELDTLREAAKSGNLIITTLSSKESSMVDAQAAFRAANKTAANNNGGQQTPPRASRQPTP